MSTTPPPPSTSPPVDSTLESSEQNPVHNHTTQSSEERRSSEATSESTTLREALNAIQARPADQLQRTASEPNPKVAPESKVHIMGSQSTISVDLTDEALTKAEDRRQDIIPEVINDTANERDVEKGPTPPPEKQKKKKDPNLVTWDGPDDPENPKNWTILGKWAATTVVSCFTFITPVSSTMLAPALSTIAKEFGITSEIESQLTLSIFVLAFAVGPLLLGPLSEVYGRTIVLQLANLIYLAFNIGCGFTQTKGQMIACRFLAGLGGSAPLAIGGGVLSDIWKSDERGRAVSIYSLAPLLGPAVGPIAGGFITERANWRWVFYATSIADGCIQVFGLRFLRETYHPKILKQKAARLRKETGNPALYTEYDETKSLRKVIQTALVRPFKLLGTQPIVQILSMYTAFLYGLMYLVLSTFATLWEKKYNESIDIGGLNYIALGIGFALGAQIVAPLNDKVYKRFRARNNGVGRPEYRIPLMIFTAILSPIGLFWYGWSAQATIHWIMPDIGAAILCTGVVIGFQCIQTYIVDSYQRYAASAMAAAVVLRSLCGFGFPLFAPYMYEKLEFGWGNSLLAFLALGVGVPAPYLLWKYGAMLRAKSPFAAG